MTTKFKRVCNECSVEFVTADLRKLFCTPACKQTHLNRDTVRGKSMVVLVQAWRAGRNTSDPTLKRAAKVAFAELCRQADAYNQEDRAADRKPKLAQVAARHRRNGVHQS